MQLSFLEDSSSDLSTPSPMPTWADVLSDEKQQGYFRALMKFIEDERKRGKRIFPKNSDIFHALAATPFAKVRVVILGQDPYHGPGQAHGLCFSVQPGIATPPSLQNIFKELHEDIGVAIPGHGNLESWARQGVLLLNAVLTVEQGKPGAHANRGWERFTDTIVRSLSDNLQGLVFFLWGSYAQKKGSIVDRSRHLVLCAPHPSPLSAHRGFFGSKPFSQANAYLTKQDKVPIDWGSRVAMQPEVSISSA